MAHGRRHGVNAPTIQIAADVAYLESSFGADSHSASPSSTASGLFQYTDEAWRDQHYTLGSKDDPSNQTAAFYNDLARYVSWYTSPATNRHIPDDMSLGNSSSSCTTAAAAASHCPRTWPGTLPQRGQRQDAGIDRHPPRSLPRRAGDQRQRLHRLPRRGRQRGLHQAGA
ncbi:hypothetical protein WJ972_11625 [Achromobacter insuavis]